MLVVDNNDNDLNPVKLRSQYELHIMAFLLMKMNWISWPMVIFVPSWRCSILFSFFLFWRRICSLPLFWSCNVNWRVRKKNNRLDSQSFMRVKFVKKTQEVSVFQFHSLVNKSLIIRWEENSCKLKVEKRFSKNVFHLASN